MGSWRILKSSGTLHFSPTTCSFWTISENGGISELKRLPCPLSIKFALVTPVACEFFPEIDRINLTKSGQKGILQDPFLAGKSDPCRKIRNFLISWNLRSRKSPAPSERKWKIPFNLSPETHFSRTPKMTYFWPKIWLKLGTGRSMDRSRTSKIVIFEARQKRQNDQNPRLRSTKLALVKGIH